MGFFRSQSIELAAKAQRVRHLIGDAYWYTDGAFKEAILLDAIRQRLPAGMDARRGFVLGDDLAVCSREQDCLIIDRSVSVPVFEAVDFHLVSPTAIVALVSVKTRLGRDEFVDAANGLASALRLACQSHLSINPMSAIFAFDERATVQDRTVAEWARDLCAQGILPVIRADPLDGDRVMTPLYLFSLHDRCVKFHFHADGRRQALFYKIEGVAAALFMHLIEKAAYEARGQMLNSAAWAALDDPAVATLTSSIEL